MTTMQWRMVKMLSKVRWKIVFFISSAIWVNLMFCICVGYVFHLGRFIGSLFIVLTFFPLEAPPTAPPGSWPNPDTGLAPPVLDVDVCF